MLIIISTYSSVHYNIISSSVKFWNLYFICFIPVTQFLTATVMNKHFLFLFLLFVPVTVTTLIKHLTST